MVCRRCGHELKEGVKFCTNCGLDLGETQDTGADSQTDKTREYKKNVVASVVFIGILIFCIIFFSDDGPSKLEIAHLRISQDWASSEIICDIANTSNTPIKKVEIALMAWDEDKFPVYIKYPYSLEYDGYFFKFASNPVNIAPHTTKSVTVEVENDISEFEYVYAFILQYEDFNGKVWKSSEKKAWLNRSGKILEQEMLLKVWTMEDENGK